MDKIFVKSINNIITKCMENNDNYEEIINIKGKTGYKFRIFLNILCQGKYFIPKFLTVGQMYHGEKFMSALYKNKLQAFCIGEWKDGKKVFEKNWHKFKAKNNAGYTETDIKKININRIGIYNIYFPDFKIDKPEYYYQTLNYFLGCLENNFIYIAQNWNSPQVRKFVNYSISVNNLHILFKKEIFSTGNPGFIDGFTQKFTFLKDQVSWGNGVCILVICKNTIINHLIFLGIEQKDYNNFSKIKERYKYLILKYHPDKNSGDGSTFLKIQESYNIIKSLFA